MSAPMTVDVAVIATDVETDEDRPPGGSDGA